MARAARPGVRRNARIVQTLVDYNNAAAVLSIGQITGAIDRAQVSMLTSFLAALLTFICAYYLLKAITHPLEKLAGIVEVMRVGDFSKRLTLERQDEFTRWPMASTAWPTS